MPTPTAALNVAKVTAPTSMIVRRRSCPSNSSTLALKARFSLRRNPVDSGTRRNGLSKADLDVFAKLREQRLERGEEAEAFPGRQVVGEDNLLQLGVAERVEVEIARQVAP